MSQDTYFSRNTKFIVEPLDGYTNESEVKVLGKATQGADEVTINSSAGNVTNGNYYVLSEIPASTSETTYAGLQLLTGISDDEYVFRALDGSARSHSNSHDAAGTHSGTLATGFKVAAGQSGANGDVENCKVTSGERRIYEIPILEGFSFSQATDNQEISISEAVSAAGTSRRGRKMFNNALQPAEFSFQTYIRPFRALQATNFLDPSQGTFHPKLGAQSFAADDQPSLVELALWKMLGSSGKTTTASALLDGTHALVGTTDHGGQYGKQPSIGFHYNTDSADGDQFDQVKPKLANFYFSIEDNVSSNGQTTDYKLTNACINEASIDFDIEGIAIVTWSGFAQTITDLTAADDGTADSGGIPTATVFEATHSTGNYIANKLSDARLTRTWKGTATNDGSTTVLTDSTQNWRASDLVGAYIKNFGSDEEALGGGGSFSTITANTATTVTSGALSNTISFATTTASSSTTLLRLMDPNATSIDQSTADKIRTFLSPGMAITFADNTLNSESIASSGSNANSAKLKHNRGNQYVPFANRVLADASMDTEGTAGMLITFTGTSSDEYDLGNKYEINKDHSVVLTGGNITISNNITYLTPNTLAKVDTPFTPMKGTFTVDGNLSCYLNDTSGTTLDSKSFYSSMQEDMIGNTGNNYTGLGSLRVTLGDHPTDITQIKTVAASAVNVNAMTFDLPRVVYDMPTISSDDIVTFDVGFHSVAKNHSDENEVKLEFHTADADGSPTASTSNVRS